jgi:DNA-binding PadR family transcriptional regulator
MSSSYAQEWPGRGAWADKGHRHHHRHRHGPGGVGPQEALNWLFARGGGRHGRPTPEEIEQLIAWRRGGSPFGGPPFGRGGGRGPGPRGRGRARRGDVRLALLRLLAEQPANGYQLMQTIEERSEGRWRPSPGSVYPTLAQLEDEGLIRSAEADGSRRFEITDSGREHVETRAEEPEPWKPVDEDGENAITELAPLVIGIGKAAWQVGSVGDEAQRARAVELLSETRRALYRILAEDHDDSDQSEEPDDSDQSAG